jgi:hypothetical protein
MFVSFLGLWTNCSICIAIDTHRGVQSNVVVAFQISGMKPYLTMPTYIEVASSHAAPNASVLYVLISNI